MLARQIVGSLKSQASHATRVESVKSAMQGFALDDIDGAGAFVVRAH